MWTFRAEQCADTGIFDACFPAADRTASFTGRAGRGVNGAGNITFSGRGGRGGGGGGGGGGRGSGRRLQAALPQGRPSFPAVFPETCSRGCQQAIRDAKQIGCMDTPELLGRTLRDVTPEQWETYEQVCDCQNARGRNGATASPEHLACCENMTASLTAVEALEHDASSTCSAEDAEAMGQTLSACTAEPAFPGMVCEYEVICPDAVTQQPDLPPTTCDDSITVDLALRGDFVAVLGSDPSGPAVEAWTQFILPGMFPGLDYKADEVLARFVGNGVDIIVSVECPSAACPESLMIGDPDCHRGNVTLGENRWVCEGGPELPAGAVLPQGTTSARITNTYIETTAHDANWSPAMDAMCKDMEADFAETGELNCLMDEDGASVRQNTLLFGLATPFRPRGSGGTGGGGRGRRLQQPGGGRNPFGGARGETECTETCRDAIQPLIDNCLDYSDIARQFQEPCLPDNVLPGGFDASCLNGVDHLLMTCNLQSIEDLLAGSCSPECGGWAGPWWASCREHLGPILDSEVPGASLMLEGFVATCPTPCADSSLTEVLETVVTAATDETAFTSAVSQAAGIAASEVDVRTLKHIAVFVLSVPGATSDYAGDSDSGAADRMADGVATATGLEPVDVSVLGATATAQDIVPAPPPPPGGTQGLMRNRPTYIDTQVAVEVAIQGSCPNFGSCEGSPMLNVVESLESGLETIATAMEMSVDEVAMIRAPVVETEVAYTLPEGTVIPDDVDLMTQLMADSGTLAVVNTVSRFVPEVTLRNDGSICGTDGSVCSDSPAADNIGTAPSICPEIGPSWPDSNRDGAINVDDLLGVLAAFGRTC